MANLEEAVVTTLWNQSDQNADLILKHNPLTAVLKENGRIKRFSGGRELRKPAMYQQTAQGGFYSGFQVFDLDSSVDQDAFQFAIRQVYEPMGISGFEKRSNQGDEQLIDLVDMKMEAAIARLKNTCDASFRGDGTAFGGIEFDGIQLAVAASPSTGTYGGINRATSTNTWARNETYSSGGLTAANIQGHLTAALMEIQRGSDGPDIAFDGPTAWQLLHSSMTAIQRINDSSSKGKAGFRYLVYDGVEHYFDGGYGGSVVGASTIRLLNSKYWSLDLRRDADFKPLNPKMDRPTDQDAFFTVIIVEGNLCCSAPPLQSYVA